MNNIDLTFNTIALQQYIVVFGTFPVILSIVKDILLNIIFEILSSRLFLGIKMIEGKRGRAENIKYSLQYDLM